MVIDVSMAHVVFGINLLGLRHRSIQSEYNMSRYIFRSLHWAYSDGVLIYNTLQTLHDPSDFIFQRKKKSIWWCCWLIVVQFSFFSTAYMLFFVLFFSKFSKMCIVQFFSACVPLYCSSAVAFLTVLKCKVATVLFPSGSSELNIHLIVSRRHDLDNP